MSDQKTQEQINKDGDQNPTPEQVTIDAKTYQALLDYLGDLEGQIKEKDDSSNFDDLDALASEGQKDSQQQQGQQQQEINFDEMSRKEFLQFTLQQLSEEVISPMAVALEEVKLNQEIDKLTRKEEYKDFWDYKDGIYKIAKDNPRLSLKKVYKLAKSEADDNKTKDNKSTNKNRSGLLKHLPNALGERPSGQSSNTTEASEPKTLREAASLAFDEIIQGNKE